MGKTRSYLFFGIVAWALMTMTLLGWWFYLAFRMFSDQVNPENYSNWQNMLIYEGLAFFTLIFLGALALIILVYRDQKRLLRMNHFFMAFSHDLKTQLMALALRVERLDGEVKLNSVQPDNIDQIKVILRNFQSKIENSLVMSSPEDIKVYNERISMKEVLSELKTIFPDTVFKMNINFELFIDKKLFKMIILNVVDNALKHSKASTVIFSYDLNNLLIKHDGLPFEGDLKLLGTQPLKQTQGGSGLGLYLSRILSKALSINLSFYKNKENQLFSRLHFSKGVL